jgi:hypothetical protein
MRAANLLAEELSADGHKVVAVPALKIHGCHAAALQKNLLPIRYYEH